LTYRIQFGTQMATVTTVSDSNPAFDQGKFDYAWWSTLLYGFDAMGWGEVFFSAANSSLPFRTRPNPVEIGDAFTSPVNHADPLHTRTTTEGTIEVDVGEHAGGFLHHRIFRVERSTGDVFAQGSFIPDGADIAERINVSEPVESGDVVELDPTRSGYHRKARGYSQLIAGVITSKPGFILGNSSGELDSAAIVGAEKGLIPETTGRPLLALMGRVPVKATTENGAIRPGDLLTVSGKPGYAMRCANARACEGAIVGKALQGLERGQDMILVVVMSH
jgi:hypothetical protein